MHARPAGPDDAAAIAAIYNAGVAGRTATFQTEPRAAEDILPWLAAGLPVVVVEDDGYVLGFAAAFRYRDSPWYAGIAEFSVYVAADARKRGVGRAAMDALAAACAEAGLWKLVSRVFPENAASRALLRSCGFREVGVYEGHGRLDGVWRDCVIVEKRLEN
jgi:L-amino acid N-acyltransferase YncA